METVNFAASTDEGSLAHNGRGVPSVEVIDLTHLGVTPPAAPTRNPAPDAFIELAAIETPIKRRAALPISEGSPKKLLCPSPQEPNGKAYTCPVCMEFVRQREPVATKCGHVYCKECIETSIRSGHKCPLCKKRLSLKNFQRIFL